jgi:hypothetical protein
MYLLLLNTDHVSNNLLDTSVVLVPLDQYDVRRVCNNGYTSVLGYQSMGCAFLNTYLPLGRCHCQTH